MTTFNGGRYVQQQLDSIESQTWQPDELTICDDGSTDDTLRILEAFRRKASFQVHIHSNDRNLGFTENFGQALLQCAGELIFLCDQDDCWYSNKVEVMAHAHITNPEQLLIIHDGELVEENLVSAGSTKLGQVMAGYGSDEWFVTGALTTIRRELLGYGLPIPPGIVGHDGWLHYVARMLDRRMVLDHSLQLLRRHSSNTSASVASSTSKINRMVALRDMSSQPPASSYQDRLLYNGALFERIRVMEQAGVRPAVIDFMKCSDRLLRERAAIISRDSLPGMGFVARKRQALRMARRGEYRYFNGFYSFVRDILR